MSMDDNGGPLSAQIVLVLVVAAVFAGVLFALWLFGVMTGA